MFNFGLKLCKEVLTYVLFKNIVFQGKQYLSFAVQRLIGHFRSSGFKCSPFYTHTWTLTSKNKEENRMP
jgi:hypothetical protein